MTILGFRHNKDWCIHCQRYKYHVMPGWLYQVLNFIIYIWIMLLSLIHLGIIEGSTVQLHMSRDMMEMSNHYHSGRILVLWS